MQLVTNAIPQADSVGSSPVSVLLVSEPGIDGVFRHVEGLIDYLLRQKVTVHLAYSTVRESPALHRVVQIVRDAGGETLDLGVGNAPGVNDLSGFLRLRQMAVRLRPAVIHAHSSKAGALARALVATGVRARYFYTPHAYYQMMGQPSARRSLFLGIERWLARIGTTVHVSDDEAAYARASFGLSSRRQKVIKNGVSGERFRPPEDGAEQRRLRRQLGLPEDALLLGTVARYSDQKQPIVLYRALLEALKLRPHLHFAHLGSGELFPVVDALIHEAPAWVRERIHRLRSLDDTAAFYRSLDGFVLPSRYEGLALAALEAAATGLPMILSSCPGNEEFQDSGMNGLQWVPATDATALQTAIVHWAQSGPVARCNHREIVLRRFSAEACFSRLLHSYRDR